MANAQIGWNRQHCEETFGPAVSVYGNQATYVAKGVYITCCFLPEGSTVNTRFDGDLEKALNGRVVKCDISYPDGLTQTEVNSILQRIRQEQGVQWRDPIVLNVLNPANPPLTYLSTPYGAGNNFRLVVTANPKTLVAPAYITLGKFQYRSDFDVRLDAQPPPAIHPSETYYQPSWHIYQQGDRVRVKPGTPFTVTSPDGQSHQTLQTVNFEPAQVIRYNLEGNRVEVQTDRGVEGVLNTGWVPADSLLGS